MRNASYVTRVCACVFVCVWGGVRVRASVVVSCACALLIVVVRGVCVMNGLHSDTMYGLHPDTIYVMCRIRHHVWSARRHHEWSTNQTSMILRFDYCCRLRDVCMCVTCTPTS